MTNAISSEGRDRQGRPWWLGDSRRVMPWALVFLLALVNLTTLLSDRIHDAAFSGVASVAAMAGPAIAETVVAHSPTMAKRRAVDGAAQKFEAERVALHTKNRALQAETEGLKVAKAALAKEHDALRALMSKRAAAVRALATRTTTVLEARSAEVIATLPFVPLRMSALQHSSDSPALNCRPTVNLLKHWPRSMPNTEMTRSMPVLYATP